MQNAGSAALANAISDPSRRVTHLLEFDWNRDGTFFSAYSDMSSVCYDPKPVSALVDGGMPANLSTVVGAASGVFTVTLRGRRRQDEFDITQLFSDYYVPSPLYTYTKRGTPVRFSVVEMVTATGPVTTRLFTGWISGAPSIQEETGSVVITASDVFDLQTAQATLPVWATGPGPTNTSTYGTGGKYAPNHSISAYWVLGELARQGGRSVWPVPRADAVAAWSCSGSMLPSVGTMGDSTWNTHAISFDFADPWVDGPYGLAAQVAQSANGATFTQCQCRANRRVSVPVNGSSQSGVYIGFAGWYYSYGSSGDSTAGNGSSLVMTVDSTYASVPGGVQMNVYGNGSMAFRHTDNGASSGWLTQNWTQSLAAGWHYHCCIVIFTSNSVSTVYRVDGALLSPSNSSGGNRGYVYSGGPSAVLEMGNAVTANVKYAPCQHVQIFAGSGTPTYDHAQRLPPYAQAGVSAPFVLERSINELTWLPDVNQASVWDTMKAVTIAELGCLYTNEFSTLRFSPRNNVWNTTINKELTAQLVPKSATQALTFESDALTYRNTLSCNATKRYAERKVVFTNTDPRAYFVDASATMQFSVEQPLNDVISTYSNILSVSATPPTNGKPITQSQVAAIKASDLTQATNGWAASITQRLDQRSLLMNWNNLMVSESQFIGSYVGGNQGAWVIAGTGYTSALTTKVTVANVSQVAAQGTVLESLPDSPWRQTEAGCTAIMQGLLPDVTRVAPVIKRLVTRFDQRIQLLDIIPVPGGSNITGTLYFQVIGKTPALRDGDDPAWELTVRVLREPDVALYDSGRYDVNVYG